MRGRDVLRAALLASWACGLALLAPEAFGQAASSVLVTEVRGTITPVFASHLRGGVERAERDGHDVFLVTLDTPGGLDTSMREIVQTFLGSRVPVVVYVSPAGARAASAGAVITLAAHVAAMAPGTNIGAATPVDLQGGEIGDKVINDAAAYAVALAEARDRDTAFARDIVRKGRSEPASRAVEIGAVDLVAPSRDDLLQRLDGRDVTLDDETTVTLRTSGATLVTYELGFFNRIRQFLADPNLAFLFLSLGTLAIIYELANPGMGFGGIVGVILIVLAMFALSVLPVNVAGVVLLVLAIGLFAAELFVPGIGVLAAGGAVSLLGAGLFLFRGDVGVDLVVILPTVAVVAGFVVLAARFVWRARRASSATGEGMLTGRVGRLRVPDDGRAQVLIDGTWWNVRAEGDIVDGERVRVKSMEGLELVVEPEGKETA